MPVGVQHHYAAANNFSSGCKRHPENVELYFAPLAQTYCFVIVVQRGEAIWSITALIYLHVNINRPYGIIL